MRETKLQKRPLLIPAAIAALMLFGALAPWSYVYYQLLRFFVCGVGAYMAFLVYNEQKLWATYLFGFIAVLFNPFAPIHISREIWQLRDVICGLIFIAGAFIFKESLKKSVCNNEKHQPFNAITQERRAK